MSYNETVIRSVYFDQAEIINSILKLHTGGKIDCDVTYGNGSFYKSINEPFHKFDISPQVKGVIKASSENLPLDAGAVNSIMFDPPFLTYVKNAREHKGGSVLMSKRFGGYWTYGELEDHYRGTMCEAYRVLGHGGVFIMKCQDIIHNHKMHCTHHNSILWADIEGLDLIDLFILPAKSRLPSPQNGKQRHARVFHSYFLVFKKRK